MSAIRTHRFEIIFTAEQWKTVSPAWRTLADRCRELSNTIWQEWEARHVLAGSHRAIRQWMRDFKAARHAKETPPKCPVPMEPPTPEVLSGKIVVKPRPVGADGKKVKRKAGEDGTTIYLACSRMFPDLNTTTITLVQQTIGQRMTGKDSDGTWNMWQAVLAGRQGRPSANRDQPIPFSPKSGRLAMFDDRTGELSVCLERGEWVSCKVFLKGSGAAIWGRIVSGEYSFRGSSVVYHQRKRKWFALIAYRMPDREAATPGKGTAILRASRKHPWTLRLPESKGSLHSWRGGNGRYVTAKRKALLSQRWDRQANYRYAGSANKGHGLKRALGPIWHLQNRWKDFVRTCNHTLTSSLVKECVDRRVGTLVYYQPMDDVRDDLFLATTGKVEGRRDASGWDWAQVATMLGYKCKEAGLHFVLRKHGRNTQVGRPRTSRRERGGGVRANGTRNKELRRA